MSDNLLREHIRTTILNRIEEQDQDKRAEALSEFMAVTGVAPREETMQSVAEMVPPIMHELYEKWIAMFADRLLETAPHNAVELLCDGTEENSAALVLTYIMFLESERMEKQIDKDLAEYGKGKAGSDELGDLASSYIRARLSAMADKAGK